MLKYFIYRYLLLTIFFCGIYVFVHTQNNTTVITGAERMNVYLPCIKNKKVGIFANHTSIVGKTHLVDTLYKLGVSITAIFGPEHGFRGKASAGEKIKNSVDSATGVPVVSLYGSKRKPSAEDLKNIDILLFDIQDVGVRFYTYISSLEELLESALENNKPVIVLDRPNPNGNYIDGPVLDKKFKSFIGMQSIPVVYGMTIGEYTNMLVNESWLSKPITYPIVNINEQPDKRAFKYRKTPLPNFQITIITCLNYTHKTFYVLPVRPSPNLPEIQSIQLYPSTCFFEGTALSEGRGTPKPFQIFGHPLLPQNLYSFTPQPNEGAKSSKHYGELCYGWNLSGTPEEVSKKVNGKIQLKWLLEAYQLFPKKDSFFLPSKSGKEEDYFFNKLAGNAILMKQIKQGKTEEQIRISWKPALLKFKTIRKKYLLYSE